MSPPVLEKLLVVLKASDVRRFKSADIEIEFAPQVPVYKPASKPVDDSETAALARLTQLAGHQGLE